MQYSITTSLTVKPTSKINYANRILGYSLLFVIVSFNAINGDSYSLPYMKIMLKAPVKQ